MKYRKSNLCQYTLFKGCSSLRSVSLVWCCSITDTSVDMLALNCTKLRKIIVRGTKVSETWKPNTQTNHDPQCSIIANMDSNVKENHRNLEAKRKSIIIDRQRSEAPWVVPQKEVECKTCLPNIHKVGNALKKHERQRREEQALDVDSEGEIAEESEVKRCHSVYMHQIEKGVRLTKSKSKNSQDIRAKKTLGSSKQTDKNENCQIVESRSTSSESHPRKKREKAEKGRKSSFDVNGNRNSHT